MGELPPSMAGPVPSDPKLLTDEEHAELASQSQTLAARLPKINLGIPKRRAQRAGRIGLQLLKGLNWPRQCRHWRGALQESIG